jgi:hypothetical protein
MRIIIAALFALVALVFATRRQESVDQLKSDIAAAILHIPRDIATTYFIKSASDGSFVRSITTTKNYDGTPAFGTVISNTTVIAALNAGQTWDGVIVLFGRTYLAHFEPRVTNGVVIGAFFGIIQPSQ